jgi:hypothetical protein
MVDTICSRGVRIVFSCKRQRRHATSNIRNSTRHDLTHPGINDLFMMIKSSLNVNFKR